MTNIRKSIILLGFVCCCLQAQGATKDPDENRPYEFGFNIEGEQHRHEKKDENGIIMGEFGFITADGVYHVTVYATDENGNFKILSMKNIRVKPYPSSSGAEKKGHSLPFPPSQNPPKTQGPSVIQGPGPASPARTCSSCSLPLTTKAPALTDYANVANNEQQNPYVGPHLGSDGSSNRGSPGAETYSLGQQNNPNYSQQGQNYPQQGGNGQQNNANYPKPGSTGQQTNGGSFGSPPGANYPNRELLPPRGGPEGTGFPADQYSEQNLESPRDRNPKRIDSYPQSQESSGGSGTVPQKPMLISAQMQIVDRNTDIHHKNPGEKDGLPQGLTKGDMVKLLYTFNYTVGFHAHFEEGYSDGSKQGYYYVTGRNGVRTRVDYVADGNGFRPKITEEVLELVSDDVPKPETEKDEKFGLKGYEFKWLYYPEESKGR